jgi:SAM-dependent methyltransferase
LRGNSRACGGSGCSRNVRRNTLPLIKTIESVPKPYGFPQALGKSVLKPAFSLKSKVAVPKLQFWNSLIDKTNKKRYNTIMENQKYTDVNVSVINKWVKNGWEWGIPISHDAFLEAKSGECNVLLTPNKFVPKEWFPPLKEKKVLGLASGGGQQMPIFAALGADCTVLDYSEEQLANEKYVADRESYSITIVKADMTETFPFDNDEFDMIFHAISNCYVEDIYHIWNECHRTLKNGGVLIAGMGNGINYLFDDIEKLPLVVANKLPYNPLRNHEQYTKINFEFDNIQFSHSLEEQIGGQIKAGFILTDLYEDYDKVGVLKDYAPQYIATRSVKPMK